MNIALYGEQCLFTLPPNKTCTPTVHILSKCVLRRSVYQAELKSPRTAIQNRLLQSNRVTLVYYGATAQFGPRPSHCLTFLDHTYAHARTHARTPCWAPLNERSLCNSGRYLHNTHHMPQTNIRALSGIRTPDVSNKVAAHLRLWTERTPG